ncbi:MAG TPA: response regulator [Terrimicrobiaceae bacterium]|nr:response regulator [Terrimicrobiaceae bacterium]
MAKILVIEDEDNFRGVLAMMLAHENHEVSTAANGVEAMQHLGATEFDVVITDVLMPEKDGVETILGLRRSSPATKIIAMSGGGRIGSEDYLTIAAKLGASATLPKPFSREQLLAVIAQALGN